MSDRGAGKPVALCGDPTCDNYGCTQEAIDAWHERQWREAGEIVRAALGLSQAGVNG